MEASDVVQQAMSNAAANDRFADHFRREHIGASQWAAACGFDPYTEPLELYERFVGLVPWESDEMRESEAVDLGHLLEDGVARRIARKFKLELAMGTTIVSPSYPFLAATPDRFVKNHPSAVLEVKTAGLVSPWGTYREDWGEAGSDEVPRRYAVQAMGQMFVLRDAGFAVDHVVIGALIAGRGVQDFVVEWDAELAEMLFARVASFWGHVKGNEPPTAQASHSALADYLQRRWPEHTKGRWLDVTGDPILEGEVAALKQARAELAKWEAQEKGARNAICSAIRDHEGIEGPFGKIAWRGVRGREQLNVEAFLTAARAQFGEGVVDALVQQHTKRGAGHRRFEPKWAEETK